MMRRLSRFDIEIVEQPIDAESVEALARVRAASPISIAADQGVIALGDAFDVCRLRAADLIVVGLHETGGLLRFCKVAHVAEAANVDVCIHGLHETGITTVAAIHAAAMTPNLDDGNQYMNNFLALGHRQPPRPHVAGRQASCSRRSRTGLRTGLGRRARGGRCLVEWRRPAGVATPRGIGSIWVHAIQPIRSAPAVLRWIAGAMATTGPPAPTTPALLLATSAIPGISHVGTAIPIAAARADVARPRGDQRTLSFAGTIRRSRR